MTFLLNQSTNSPSHSISFISRTSGEEIRLMYFLWELCSEQICNENVTFIFQHCWCMSFLWCKISMYAVSNRFLTNIHHEELYSVPVNYLFPLFTLEKQLYSFPPRRKWLTHQNIFTVLVTKRRSHMQKYCFSPHLNSVNSHWYCLAKQVFISSYPINQIVFRETTELPEQPVALHSS